MTYSQGQAISQGLNALVGIYGTAIQTRANLKANKLNYFEAINQITSNYNKLQRDYFSSQQEIGIQSSQLVGQQAVIEGMSGGINLGLKEDKTRSARLQLLQNKANVERELAFKKRAEYLSYKSRQKAIHAQARAEQTSNAISVLGAVATIALLAL